MLARDVFLYHAIHRVLMATLATVLGFVFLGLLANYAYVLVDDNKYTRWTPRDGVSPKQNKELVKEFLTLFLLGIVVCGAVGALFASVIWYDLGGKLPFVEGVFLPFVVLFELWAIGVFLLLRIFLDRQQRTIISHGKFGTSFALILSLVADVLGIIGFYIAYGRK